MYGISDDLSAQKNPIFDHDERVYFVPYRWWKEVQDSPVTDSDSDSNSDARKGLLYVASSSSSSSSPYAAGPMKIINNIFNPDLIFNLRGDDHFVLNNDNRELRVSAREYALVTGQMWLRALKWHSDSKNALKDGKSFSASEYDMADVYPLQLRLSVLRETNSLGVKISKRDNAVEPFRRACKIFTFESDLLRIWDFSGQTTLFFTNNNNNLPKDLQRQLDQEILLELQIYGLSDSLKYRDGKKDELATPDTNFTSSSYGASLLLNGGSGNTKSNFLRTNSSTFCGRSSEAGSLGLTGLQNLGNTCFMNSALQCLAHTPKLVDYFLGDYSREINRDNPLGMDGEISLAFGDLIRKLWAPGATPVAPRIFKSKLARFAPQFSGFNQHDSQELLAFLLDGLHEDLNRVKCKPYVEAKDGEGRLDDEVADEYWRNHLARNDSIIVDVCQGQYRSTLVCPVCQKVSVTFDPFMYLSLPLPSTTMRTMSLTVMSTDGSTLPLLYTISVPKYGKCQDLIQALSTACSLMVNETLLVAEIFNNRIIRFLEEPTDSISLIRDDDRLVAYRLSKDVEKVSIVVFMHQQMVEHYAPAWKAFGVPLVAMISESTNGSDIRDLYLKLLNPFLMPAVDTLNEHNTSESSLLTEVKEIGDAANPISGVDANLSDETGSSSEDELQFHLTDVKGAVMETKISINDPVPMAGLPRKLNILVSWPEKLIDRYDTCMLGSLPEIYKPSTFPKKLQESVSLYKCLEAFLKEEPLGPEDMWYCPGCEKHRQASKKLDLWRLPEILVIHLKRFSYSRFMKNKLEAYVEFPINNLDLSTYIAFKNDNFSKQYMLYAVSNHYGSMGGGHYTAFVHHGGDRWYDFDDSHVSPISEDKIKTSAAYVLFYRRAAKCITSE